MQKELFILKGDICYCLSKDELICKKNSYLVCKDNDCEGVYEELPDHLSSFPIEDWSGRLILPGLVDLHTHAPQYAFRGLGLDLELLDWLNRWTFPEEEKYCDFEYAKKAYQIFSDDLKYSATTRACIFGTIHVPATELLMDLMEESGLITYIGKVNMDRNAMAGLTEVSADQAYQDTLDWYRHSGKKYTRTYPILTPRFIPSCSDKLMMKLARLQKNEGLPMQSHLSENLSEIEWVSKLSPLSKHYADAYKRLGFLEPENKTIMAHCVYSENEEIELLKESNTFIAHCPSSNTNLASGIAPIREYLDRELLIGLGSDIAAGDSLSMFQIMAEAIKVSKLRWRLVDHDKKPLTFPEVFYLATKGGGAFFGDVGSFEKGYEFDAVIIDDTEAKHPQKLELKDRLERLAYLSHEAKIAGKYVRGLKVL